ncbi:MAG TPA: type I DNA topoisomerase [Patescibacteria group bacterium]|nr:type I DNA topoisomerase [Patescibacteria group bacterium]
MQLVIVESPTKAKTVQRFLGNTFDIKASMGHVMDLPKSTLGVDVAHDFAPQYEISPDKKKTIDELKRLAKRADSIILATDPDREGEAISAHIKELLQGQTKKKFVRIVFHEITKEAIDEALAHPGDVNEALVNAQTARRVLDRLVGYKISPVLWQKVRRGLSAGRVQSVALRLIVEREREIQKFIKEPYWTISILLSRNEKSSVKDNTKIDFELIEVNGQKIEKQEKLDLYDGTYTVTKTNIATEERSQYIEKDLQTKHFIVREVLQRKTKRHPQPPFTTSTLQQQAAGRFGYSGKRTMSLAQKLYEEGYITYHRTDSVNLAQSAILAMRNYIEKSFGKNYIPPSPNFYTTKQKLAQEAHEAIRPTRVEQSTEIVAGKLGRDFAKLYDLIWRRAVASQMNDALIESTTVFVNAVDTAMVSNQGEAKQLIQQAQVLPAKESLDPNQTPPYLLKTTGSVLVFDGFLKVNPFGLQDRNLPRFIALEKLSLQDILAEKHETPPPPRYNDASLIASLEEGGIGRPSTYASIISTIEARQYIERDQGRFLPTTVGTAVTDFLVKNFPDIDDIPFTATLEDELDEIASGKRQWVPVIREFYQPFEKKLEVVKKADRVEIPAEETGEKCPKDGAPLVVRVGRFGKFISCKNFPACDFKKQFIEETPFTCPKDGGKIIVKKTKKGRNFYGCSNYPRCDFAVWKLQDLKKPFTKKTPKKKQKENKV